MRVFNVYRPNFANPTEAPVLMDTFLYPAQSVVKVEGVRRELVEVDGYPDYIWVEEVK